MAATGVPRLKLAGICGRTLLLCLTCTALSSPELRLPNTFYGTAGEAQGVGIAVLKTGNEQLKWDAVAKRWGVCWAV